MWETRALQTGPQRPLWSLASAGRLPESRPLVGARALWAGPGRGAGRRAECHGRATPLLSSAGRLGTTREATETRPGGPSAAAAAGLPRPGTSRLSPALAPLLPSQPSACERDRGLVSKFHVSSLWPKEEKTHNLPPLLFTRELCSADDNCWNCPCPSHLSASLRRRDPAQGRLFSACFPHSPSSLMSLYFTLGCSSNPFLRKMGLCVTELTFGLATCISR